jgi:hypothetical protein
MILINYPFYSIIYTFYAYFPWADEEGRIWYYLDILLAFEPERKISRIVYFLFLSFLQKW